MHQNRSILFIDGSNWYHGLKKIEVNSGGLNYHRVARKLLINRELCEIRYYVGAVSGDRRRIAAQRKFLERLRLQKIRVFLGRIKKPDESEAKPHVPKPHIPKPHVPKPHAQRIGASACFIHL